jgi:hypothetical protein
VIQAGETYKFDPSCVVPLTWLIDCQWIASIRLEISLAVGQAAGGCLLLGSPAEVEGSQHRNVDAKACEHEFDAAQHECREGSSGKVVEKVDREDQPEADDADNHTTVQISGCSGHKKMWLTYAAPSAKHEITANFSVLRIWSFQTDLIGSAKTNKSVRTFVAISALRTKIWSMQCPMRSSDHCCFIGLHRKIKMKVKTMAQMMTIAMPARIQFLMWIAKTRM